MVTVAAIDAGYGAVKATAQAFGEDEKAQTRRVLFPATALSVPSPLEQGRGHRVRMAGANVEVPNIISFDVGNGVEHYVVGSKNAPHFLSPDTRTLFPPPVLAMLIYALHKTGANKSSLVVIGIPIGHKMSGEKIPGPRWPKRYFFQGREYELAIGDTIVTGQTVGTIVSQGISQGIVVDVGYGTTDIVVVQGKKIVFATSIAVGVSDAVALAMPRSNDPQSAVKENPRLIAGVCERINEHLSLVMRQIGDNLPVYLTGGGGEIVARTGLISNSSVVKGALWANAIGLLEVATAVARRRGLVP